jgi:hypothetical protein
MSSKFTVDFRISARLTLLQALITVTIFILFTVERGLSFRMKAAMALKIHGDRSLLKKPRHVKFTSFTSFEPHCVWSIVIFSSW